MASVCYSVAVCPLPSMLLCVSSHIFQKTSEVRHSETVTLTLKKRKMKSRRVNILLKITHKIET